MRLTRLWNLKNVLPCNSQVVVRATARVVGCQEGQIQEIAAIPNGCSNYPIMNFDYFNSKQLVKLMLLSTHEDERLRNMRRQ